MSPGFCKGWGKPTTLYNNNNFFFGWDLVVVSWGLCWLMLVHFHSQSHAIFLHDNSKETLSYYAQAIYGQTSTCLSPAHSQLFSLIVFPWHSTRCDSWSHLQMCPWLTTWCWQVANKFSSPATVLTVHSGRNKGHVQMFTSSTFKNETLCWGHSSAGRAPILHEQSLEFDLRPWLKEQNKTKVETLFHYESTKYYKTEEYQRFNYLTILCFTH